MRIFELKIALFLPSLRGGGAERVMLNLSKGLINHGYQVNLVLVKAEGDYLSQVPAGVRIMDLKSPRVLLSLSGLINYLRHEQPIAMLSAMGHTNIIAIWAKRIAGVKTKLVVSEHSTLSKVTKQTRNTRSRIMPLLMRFTYPKADAVIAVSKGVAEDLAQVIGLSRSLIQVIYNPVVDEELLAKSHEPLDHPWFQPDEPPVILSVGRLTQVKDYSTLLRAFALVRAKVPARLMILGEGEDRSHLEKLTQELDIAEDVAMPGFVYNPYNYMAKAKVFALSSQWEGFGMVLVEAMACGTPVVSTNCPYGPSEILADGKYGKLVPVGNPETLAIAILQTLKNPPNKSVLKDRIKAFHVDDITQKYLQVLLPGEDEYEIK